MPFESDFPQNPRNIHFDRTTAPVPTFAIHYHPFYELYYFEEGDADYLVEGKEYHLTPHSLILLSPYVFHGVRVNSSNPYVRCAVHFRPEDIPAEHRNLLLAAFPGSQKNSSKEIFYEHTEQYGLRQYLEHLIASQKQPASSAQTYYPIYLDALLAQVSIMCQTLDPSAVTNCAPDNITQLLSYLNEHLAENITLDDLARRFYISKYYINRAFRKATGTTVMDYLIYKRVVLAKQLMQNGTGAAEAALSSGFGDYSDFYRAYRKVFGCSPSRDLKKDGT